MPMMTAGSEEDEPGDQGSSPSLPSDLGAVQEKTRESLLRFLDDLKREQEVTNYKLKKSRNLVKERDRSIQALETQLKAKESEVLNKDAELQELEGLVQSKDKELQQQGDQLNDWEKRLQASESGVQRLREENAELSQTQKDAQEQVTKLHSEAEQTKSSHGKMVKFLEDRNTALSSERDQALQKQKKAEEEARTAQEKLETTQKQFATASATNSRLTQKEKRDGDKIKDLKETIKSLTSEKDLAIQRRRTAEKELKTVSEKLKSTEAKLASTTAVASGLREKENSLRDQVTKLEAIKVTAQEAIKDAERKSYAVNEELKTTKTQLDSEKAAHTTTKALLQSRLNDIRKLKADLVDYEERIKFSKGSLEDAKVAKARAEEDHKATQEQLRLLKIVDFNSKETIQILEDKVKELENKLATAKEDSPESRAIITNLENTIQRLQNQLEHARRESNTILMEIHRGRPDDDETPPPPPEEVSTLEEALSQVREKARSIQLTKRMQRVRIDDQKKEMKRMREEVNKQAAKIKELSEQNSATQQLGAEMLEAGRRFYKETQTLD